MAQDDTKDTGIPTRAIHEAYLSMQQTHRQFRQAKDQQDIDPKQYHASFQDAVLTFYELIRHHMKRKSGMSAFWEGELPDYPPNPWDSFEQAASYCRRYGVAVWGVQKHVETRAKTQYSAQMAQADGFGSLEDWHRQLGLGDRQRVVAVKEEDAILIWVELRAVCGLKQLDHWDTQIIRNRDSGRGFMSGEVTTRTELRFIDEWRLTKAKRLLAEAADKMQLLSRVDVEHEDGAIVNFDQSREGAQAEYRSAEYSSSPEI